MAAPYKPPHQEYQEENNDYQLADVTAIYMAQQDKWELAKLILATREDLLIINNVYENNL